MREFIALGAEMRRKQHFPATDEFGVHRRSKWAEDLYLAETSRDAAGVGTLVVDAGWLREVDLRAIEALARAALRARRGGGQLRVTNVPPDLRALLDLVGLSDVILSA